VGVAGKRESLYLGVFPSECLLGKGGTVRSPWMHNKRERATVLGSFRGEGSFCGGEILGRGKPKRVPPFRGGSTFTLRGRILWPERKCKGGLREGTAFYVCGEKSIASSSPPQPRRRGVIEKGFTATREKERKWLFTGSHLLGEILSKADKKSVNVAKKMKEP